MKTVKLKFDCIFCNGCGSRIGWAEDEGQILTILYCDNCKVEKAEG